MFAHYTESESAVVFVLYLCESYYNSYNCFVDYDKRKHNNSVPFGHSHRPKEVTNITM